MQIPESGQCLLIKSGIPGSGIRNTAQGRNPESHQRFDSGLQVQLTKNPEYCTGNQESMAWILSWIPLHGASCFEKQSRTKNIIYQ